MAELEEELDGEINEELELEKTIAGITATVDEIGAALELPEKLDSELKEELGKEAVSACAVLSELNQSSNEIVGCP